jgi:predicted metal-dependent peptidase
MNPTAADVIAAGRMQVYLRHPYLSAALFALRPHPAPGLGTVAVDAGWRLYYDPDVVLRWHQEAEQGKIDKVAGSDDWHHGVASAIFHELGHCLRQHLSRRGDRDPRCWNEACDREINDDLITCGWRLPVKKPLLPEQIGKPAGLTAEEYYTTESASAQPPDGVGCGASCGGAAGNPTQWEKDNASGSDANAPAAAGELEQQVTLRKTALDTMNHAKARGRGTVPGGLRAWAEEHLEPPKIPWRSKLAGLFRTALSSCAGACDFTWRKVGRRSLYAAGRTGWPLTPALHQPIPRVCFVLDVSGSMSGGSGAGRTLQDEALSEALGIAQACGSDTWGVACDADVQAAGRVANVRDLEKLNKGGGGTVLTPGFQAAKKLKADIVVFLTDGEVGNGWPTADDCRGTRVLAAIVGGETKQVPAHIPFVEVV